MPLFSQTPLLQSRLSEHRPPVWFKMDCFQPTGSFKIRGMDNFVHQALKVHHKPHFVASSGGNAGFSLAYAAARHKCPVTVVVPGSTPKRMQDIISGMGAKVIVHGKVWNEADELARALSQEPDSLYVSPFDHQWLWEGHASIVDELVAQYAALELDFPRKIVLSVGGGGLFSGVMRGLAKHKLLDQVSVVGAETEGAASFALALAEDRLGRLDRISTIAGSLGAPQIAEKAFEWMQMGQVESHVISDQQAVAACRSFLTEFNVVVEPACGAALSYVYRPDFAEEGVLAIACGGVAWSIDQQMQFEGQFQQA